MQTYSVYLIASIVLRNSMRCAANADTILWNESSSNAKGF